MKSFNELISNPAQKAMQENRRIRQVISRIVPAEMLEHIQFCRIDNTRAEKTDISKLRTDISGGLHPGFTYSEDRKPRRRESGIQERSAHTGKANNQNLSVTVDSASWIARLRFSSSQILRALDAEGIYATSISWHVTPAKAVKAKPRRKLLRTRLRSKHAASIVQSTAADMEEDELKRALLKMAAQLAKEK